MKNASFVFCGSKGTHRGTCQVPDDYFDTEELFIGQLGLTYRHEPIEKLIKQHSPDQKLYDVAYWNIEPLN